MSTLKSPTRTLTSILMECGIVSQEQVNQGLVRQRETKCLIGEALVALGFTSEESIGWALSKQLGIPFVDVRPDAVDAAEVKRFPEVLLRRIQATPLFGSRNELTVAMADPTDQDAIHDIKSAGGGAISIVIGSPGAIRRAIDRVYNAKPGAVWDPAPTAQVVAPAQTVEPRIDVVFDRAGMNLLLFHVRSARAKGASEIHFLPRPEGIAVFYRTDAGLEAQQIERAESGIYLRARLGVLGIPDVDGQDVFARRGSLAFEAEGESMTLDVSHCATALGISTVIRMGPRASAAPELAELGVSPIAEAEIREMAEGPEGLVIVYGPPRSGGSLVLASLASLASRPDRRTLILEPAATAPHPGDATRVRFTSRKAAAAQWEEMVVGQGADVAVLDDVLRGDSIRNTLSGVSVGRLLFVRTDWLDGEALLRFLASDRNGRSVLAYRPFAMLGLPAARREGSATWSDTEQRAGSLAATVLSDEDRDAISNGTARS